MEMILPPKALPLLILFILLLPLALLAGESLLAPLLDWLPTVMSATEAGNGLQLPIHFFFKLIAFALLSFFGLFQLLMRINMTYYATWARTFPRPHSLHVEYEPDESASMVALINWYLFRLLMVVGPPVGLGLLTVGVGLLAFYFYNVVLANVPASLPIQFIVGLFIILLLGMFTVLALLNSLWTFATTIFGSVVAVTEPDLAAQSIFDRCGRIVFATPMVFGLYLATAVFVLLVLSESAALLYFYDIDTFLSPHANFPLIFGLEIFTLVAYLMLHYGRFFVYHQSLVQYYAKLPRQFKDQFHPPR